MSILMETNKMLREEKDKSEQELQLTQAKVSSKIRIKNGILVLHMISAPIIYAGFTPLSWY